MRFLELGDLGLRVIDPGKLPGNVLVGDLPALLLEEGLKRHVALGAAN